MQIARIGRNELKNLNLGDEKRTLFLINYNKTTNCSIFLQISRNLNLEERHICAPMSEPYVVVCQEITKPRETTKGVKEKGIKKSNMFWIILGSVLGGVTAVVCLILLGCWFKVSFMSFTTIFINKTKV